MDRLQVCKILHCIKTDQELLRVYPKENKDLLYALHFFRFYADHLPKNIIARLTELKLDELPQMADLLRMSRSEMTKYAAIVSSDAAYEQILRAIKVYNKVEDVE